MKKITGFIRDIRAEFTHITWPVRNEALRLTILVIVFSAIFALFLGAVDYFFSEGLRSFILSL
jgi:preprotein translocase SecE subunit